VVAVESQGILFARGQSHQGIAAQGVVVVEILVSGGKAQNALGKEFGQRMLDETLIAPVFETGSKTAGQPQRAIELAQGYCTSCA